MSTKSIFEMSAEERAALSDEDIQRLEYTILYFEPWDATKYSLEHQDTVLRELRERLRAIEATQPKPERKAPKMVQCDCGHSVLEGQRMTTSSGTSCPDCYDRMSR